MTYRDQFLRLALDTGILSVQNDRVKFDGFFGGNAHAVELAAHACRERMNKTPPLYEAEVLMSFDHPGYPLLVAAALPFQGGDAKGFVSFGYHSNYPRDFLRGKNVAILGTREDEAELNGAAGYITGQYGGNLIGAVMLFSPEFIQKQNESIAFPVMRIIREQDIWDQLPIDTDRHDYLLPG